MYKPSSRESFHGFRLAVSEGGHAEPAPRHEDDTPPSAAYGESVYAKMSLDDLVGLLDEAGYSAKVVRDNAILVQVDNSPVVFFLTDQLSIEAIAGFPGLNASLDTINSWNKSKRFSHACLDDDGEPILKLDLDLEGGGVTKGHVKVFFSLVRLSVTTFRAYLAGK